MIGGRPRSGRPGTPSGCDAAAGRRAAPAPQASLEALCARVAALEGVACGLAHERVEREPGGLLPVRDPVEIEHGYRRVAFCPAAVRRSRLGCAHTTARQDLRDALRALAARAGAADDADALERRARELDEIEPRIYAIDRRKSDLEIAHARLCDPAAAGGAGPAAHDPDRDGPADARLRVEAALAALVRAHGRLVLRLEALRDDVLGRLAGAGGRDGSGDRRDAGSSPAAYQSDMPDQWAR